MKERPTLLTVQEAAQILRIQRAKVYLLIETKAIHGFKVGADWRIRLDSVEKLVGPVSAESFGELGIKIAA